MKNTLPKKRKTYSPDDIRRAAQLYAVVGNFKKVSRQTGIPDTTLLYWRDNKDEWVTMYEQIRAEKRDELDAHFTSILDKAMEGLQDRLQNGDEYFDAKTGQHYRKKVSARDLVIVGGSVFDKRQILNNQPTSVRGTVSAEDRLKELAKVLTKDEPRGQEGGGVEFICGPKG